MGGMYEQLGVDPDKVGVREAFGGIVVNDFPQAFCRIFLNPRNRRQARVKHSDGSGSKSVQRCLHFLETRDETIFRDDVLDALSMNTADAGASGFVYYFELTDHLAINGTNLPKKVILMELAEGFRRAIKLYRQHGIRIVFAGGETADLPDQVGSYIFDMDVSSAIPRRNVIKGNVIPGDSIFGFSSAGKATWESSKNSGIMANGLTLTRIVLMADEYAKKYPFLCRPDKPFRGRFRIGDFSKDLNMGVSEAILSPTRQWVILIKMIIDALKREGLMELLHAICVNTGGGLTKVRHVGSGIRYEKQVPDPPPIFKLVQSESGEKWREMCRTFNLGIGIEIVGDDQFGNLSRVLAEVSMKSGVELFELGRCSRAKGKENEVHVRLPQGKFDF